MNKRESAYNISYSRILFIDKEICSGHYPNAKTLAQKYEVSESTIKRDISYMRDILRAPIKYNASQKGHYYEDKNFRLPAVFTNLDIIFSAALALKLLAPYKNTPIYNRIKITLDNIDKSLFSKNDRDNLWLEKRISFLYEKVYKSVDSRTWDIVTFAMHQNKYIEFFYNSGYDKKYYKKTHVIATYQILLKNGIWYLLGKPIDSTTNEVESFSISRIEKLKMLDIVFEISDEYKYFDVERVGQEALQHQKCSILLFYDKDDVVKKDNIIKEFSKNNDIIFVEEIDVCTVEIIFYATDIKTVLDFILSQGANAVPTGPQELISLYRQEIESMLSNLSKILPK